MEIILSVLAVAFAAFCVCLGVRIVNRRELGWVTVPVFIAVGAYVSFGLARQYQGSDVVLNKGHQFGVDLPDDDKAALIEYLKTL